VVGLVE